MQRKSLKLLEQVQEIIKSYDFALTLRQIYYQLVSKQIIANRQNLYQGLSRLCVIGRNNGILDEESFADRLRQVDKPSSWTDIDDFMNAVRQSYCKDKWENQDNYIEIWIEKDALRNVLTDVTYPYDVNLMVARGQLSRTEVYKTYCRHEQQLKRGKKCYLFYAGDFDPSGLSIYHSLVERIAGYGDYGRYITFNRIALTPEQIEKYGLPSDPAKKTDPSYKRFVSEYGNNVVELDALPPDVLRNLVKVCIEKHLDLGLFEQVQKKELEEQAELQILISQASSR